MGKYRSTRDATGHGSVIASVAAGAEISSVGVLGFAYGDAQGIAPKARIAVYKACWWKICTLTDTLVVIDAAIFDGVDILSVSMGNNSPKPFYNDAFMISTLKAAQNNIFVTFGAGNMGPTPSTVVNSAPWVTTVGSSTIDKTYPAKVRLENGEQVPANSLYCGKSVTDDAFSLKFYNICTYDNIISKSMKGKILICNASDIDVDSIAFTVAKAQGVGYIQLNVGGDKDLSIPLI
ncbi:Subtilisin-like protease SBT1.2 [Camellia lanceoleosa]|uniref:Subtilisin-like protease SBT1.2 n=1 Tax=Camellia lanceoleosa TaxID=1840588 RepID=A0ACC0IHS4_9ERIC|nr:Subtilisin-like protease SBT1.2 [Camellia lanceoleosa]